MPSSRSRSAAKEPVQHFAWLPGQRILDRYSVQRMLGEGTFARVLLVLDDSGHSYALKVIRATRRYVVSAQYEAEVLELLQSTSEFATGRVVRLIRHFPLGEHYCLLYECLGPTLYDELKRNQFRGFEIGKVQSVARELLEAVAFLHANRVVHTDIKLENVSFTDADRCSVKLIDFGSAVKCEEACSSLISTRQYRAPEVVLGLDWDEKSDIWSLGCVLAELLTGALLFPTHSDYEHLAMIEKVCGRIPLWMARKTRSAEFFDHRQRLTFPRDASDRQIRAVKKLRVISDLVPPLHREFRILLTDMLEIDPGRRPRARELLRSTFFARMYV